MVRETNLGYEIFRLLRPAQALKQLTIFTALVLSQYATNFQFISLTFLGAIIATLFSSAGYCINDIFDRKQDATNARTKQRPIASGALSVRTALIVAIVLFFVGIGSALLISNIFLCLMFSLLANSVIYTIWIKKIPFLEILSVSINFSIRVVSGCYIITKNDLFLFTPTHWLFWVPALIAMTMLLYKRLSEKQSAHQRNVLQKYSLDLLKKSTVFFTIISIIAYICYSIIGPHKYFFLTIPFFCYLIIWLALHAYSGDKHVANIQKIISEKWWSIPVFVYLIVLVFSIYVLPKIL